MSENYAGFNHVNTVCPLKLFIAFNLRNKEKFQRANVTAIRVC